MRFKIGICGGRETTDNGLTKARELGKLIAKKNYVLVTGATFGIAQAAAEGAKEANGEVIGFSPAKNEEEHKNIYKMPLDSYDVINYTGVGKMRNWIFVRSCDAIIVVSGQVGTLNELTIALDEGIPAAALTNTDGVADHVTEILRMCKLDQSAVIIDGNPNKLLEQLSELLRSKQ